MYQNINCFKTSVLHISSNNFTDCLIKCNHDYIFPQPSRDIVNNNRCYRENISFLNQSISELVSVQIQLDLGLCLFGCGPMKSQMTHSVRKF